MALEMEDLVEKIKSLEVQLFAELEKKEKQFFYQVEKKRVRFENEVEANHRLLIKKIRYYLKDAAFLNILTAPVIWLCLVPAVIMDIVVTFYQWVCFPVYGIPRVIRGDYVIVDRHFLSYLNPIEKINCVYCGYFNGVVAYAREVGARTEQYWCPIKHARRIRTYHGRYNRFLDFGDGDGYRKKIEDVRRDFSDLKKGS